MYKFIFLLGWSTFFGASTESFFESLGLKVNATRALYNDLSGSRPHSDHIHRLRLCELVNDFSRSLKIELSSKSVSLWPLKTAVVNCALFSSKVSQKSCNESRTKPVVEFCWLIKSRFLSPNWRKIKSLIFSRRLF